MIRKSIFAAVLAVFLLPAFVNTREAQNSPFNMSAQAGRSTPGGRWCECGESGCICDPGEEPCTGCPGQGLTVQSNNESAPVEVDTGSMMTLAVAAVLLVLRLRQIS